jgi:SagB-type dehydrogenase family enzyme
MESHQLDDGRIALAPPSTESGTSVEASLRERRSVRQFGEKPVSLDSLSQLLWAAQGVTDAPNGLRTAPSAGALYPLELYAVVGQVEGLATGVYRYDAVQHTLVKIADRDARPGVALAALGQSAVADAPAVILFAAVYERTTGKYGERGVRYVHMEAGHAAQNVYLQAVSLGLGTVVIGAFVDEGVRRAAGLPDNEHPLYLMPVGHP